MTAKKFIGGSLPFALLICCIGLWWISCSKPNQTTVAIVKFTAHPALDELEQGFVDVVTTEKKVNPQLVSVVIEQYDANQKDERAKEYAEACNRPDVKLILAIGTPAALAVSSSPSQIPCLYGAVAAPREAGIIPSPRITGIRNSGPNIIREALQFIQVMFPNAKRLGTLYNPNEQNSKYVQGILKDECDKLASSLTLVQLPVTDPTQVSSQAEHLAREVDVIYSANDNTVNRAVASVVAITRAKKVPFVLGDLSTLKSGALASVGLGYESMGKSLGLIAVQLLQGKPLSSFPPQDAPTPEIWINKETMDYLALTVPSKLASRIKVKSF